MVQFVQSAERVTAADRRTGEGTLGQFVNDPRVYRELQAVAWTNLNAITARDPQRARAVSGSSLNDPALANSLTAHRRRTSTTIAGRLNRGEGTTGKLLNDDGAVRAHRHA